MSAYVSAPHAVLPGDPHWTFGYRKPTANCIYRVSDWAGTWGEARDRGKQLADTSPDGLHFFVLTTRAYDDRHLNEDSHNMLTASGKRIPLVDITEGDLLERIGASR